MKLRIIALLLGFALAAATSANAETVTIESGEYGNFGQLFAREAPTHSVNFAATLAFPDEVRDRYTVVVVVHTLGGYQEMNEGWHAEQFRKAGFATVTYNSVAARRLREGAALAAWPSALAEAYAVLEWLAGHAKIDADRAGLYYLCRGGRVRAADRDIDLPWRVPCLDGSEPWGAAFLSAIRQHAEVSLSVAGCATLDARR
jgi:hypothetical protein